MKKIHKILLFLAASLLTYKSGADVVVYNYKGTTSTLAAYTWSSSKTGLFACDLTTGSGVYVGSTTSGSGKSSSTYLDEVEFDNISFKVIPGPKNTTHSVFANYFGSDLGVFFESAVGQNSLLKINSIGKTVLIPKTLASPTFELLQSFLTRGAGTYTFNPKETLKANDASKSVSDLQVEWKNALAAKGIR